MSDVPPSDALRVRQNPVAENLRRRQGAGYRYMRPGIETAPWRARLMEVVDPFGNLRFNEDLARPA